MKEIMKNSPNLINRSYKGLRRYALGLARYASGVLLCGASALATDTMQTDNLQPPAIGSPTKVYTYTPPQHWFNPVAEYARFLSNQTNCFSLDWVKTNPAFVTQWVSRSDANDIAAILSNMGGARCDAGYYKYASIYIPIEGRNPYDPQAKAALELVRKVANLNILTDFGQRSIAFNTMMTPLQPNGGISTLCWAAFARLARVTVAYPAPTPPAVAVFADWLQTQSGSMTVDALRSAAYASANSSQMTGQDFADFWTALSFQGALSPTAPHTPVAIDLSQAQTKAALWLIANAARVQQQLAYQRFGALNTLIDQYEASGARKVWHMHEWNALNRLGRVTQTPLLANYLDWLNGTGWACIDSDSFISYGLGHGVSLTDILDAEAAIFSASTNVVPQMGMDNPVLYIHTADSQLALLTLREISGLRNVYNGKVRSELFMHSLSGYRQSHGLPLFSGRLWSALTGFCRLAVVEPVGWMVPTGLPPGYVGVNYLHPAWEIFDQNIVGGDANACGTTCLAMILDYYTHRITNYSGAIALDRSLRPPRDFTPPNTLEDTLRTNGFTPYQSNDCSTNDLKSALAKGKAVLVMIDGGPTPHYVVALGYYTDTLTGRCFVKIADPEGCFRDVNMSDFEYLWADPLRGVHLGWTSCYDHWMITLDGLRYGSGNSPTCNWAADAGAWLYGTTEGNVTAAAGLGLIFPPLAFLPALW